MTVLDIEIIDSLDDTWHRGSDHLFLDDNTVVSSGNNDTEGDTFSLFSSGLRFPDVTIPKGATIDVAYITFKPNVDLSGTVVRTNLVGEDADNAGQISDDTDWHNRTLTTALTAWDNIPAWSQNVEENSPSIVSIIQEIVDRAGWASGNALQVFWLNDESDFGSGIYRSAYSRDNINAQRQAPILHVEYTEAAGQDLVRILDETVQQAEDVVRALGLTRPRGETEQIAEAIVRAISLVRPTAETEQIAEEVVRALERVRAVNETESIGEDVQRILGLTRLVNETEQLSEVVLQVLGRIRAVDETEQLSETVIPTLGRTRDQAETERVVEAVVATLALTRVLSEAEQLTEALVVSRRLVRIVDETIAVQEVIARPRSLIRVIEEAEQVAADAQRKLALVRLLSEGVGVQEAITKIVGAGEPVAVGIRSVTAPPQELTLKAPAQALGLTVPKQELVLTA